MPKYTPFMLAVYRGQNNVARFFVEVGVDTGSRCYNHIVKFAVEQGDSDMIRILRDAGFPQHQLQERLLEAG
jgi:hypothetical protein